jgi:hypothetical protein
MNEKILKQFIDSFKTDSNKYLIESINNGYKCIFEGYEDVRDIETEDAVTMFNRNAAYNTNYGTNPIMAFLHRSGEELRGRYSEDPNPELDYIRTTVHFEPTDGIKVEESYDNYEEAETSDNDYSEGFGLTHKDMKDLI